MKLVVNIQPFIVQLLNEFFKIINTFFYTLKSIIIYQDSNITVTLYHFFIGLLVISIVIGAFVHINTADNFYTNKKD